ncbi:hypothetical protein VB713_16010 [Anabaena cylindrica UHCC 0172]|uniref:hypothetical protein n=1 Tax=Anabaena cylindrica TaxID=1165 RepID=UPI002B215BBF|nr:hypothetical protein [Anabaena cylindrica]MEA5552448.1 hypothetical protein [Anabaena cylindrica UHCC 0172]
MAVISISNLNVAGSDLFMDSESFMNDLTEQELTGTNGGITPVIIYTVAVNTWWFVGGAALSAAGAIAETTR